MSNLKVAAAYIRVSTHGQEDLSPDSQRKLLIDYAKKHDMILTNDTIYQDNGISGRKAEKRPQFMKMISAAKSDEHPFDVILVWKFSRFARNQEESIVYKSMLRNKCNVDVVSISEPVSNDMFGGLIERIIEWMDEFYSIRLSQEVHRGMVENAQRGNYQSSAPFGYSWNNGELIPNENADQVQWIYENFLHSSSPFSIAKQLNAKGLRTIRGKLFESRSINYILTNETYIGRNVWNKIDKNTGKEKPKTEWIVENGTWEPLVSEELFLAVQKKINTRLPRPKRKPFGDKRHWLSGLLVCSNCGGKMYMIVDNKNDRIYFQCGNYQKSKCKISHHVPLTRIEPIVLGMIKDTLDRKDIVYDLIERTESATESIQLDASLKSLANKEKRIKEAYRNGIDTLEEYKENKEILQKERLELEQQLNDSKSPFDDVNHDDAALEKLQNVYQILENKSISNSKKSEFALSIISKIIYNKPNESVDIYYYYKS